MADNRILDADAILAQQNAAFQDQVLGGSQGGYAPSFPATAPPGPSPDSQAERFRRAVMGSVPVAGPAISLAQEPFAQKVAKGMLGNEGARLGPALPYNSGVRGGLDAVGAAVNPLGVASGAYSALSGNSGTRRALQSALGLPHDPYVPQGVGGTTPEGLSRLINNSGTVTAEEPSIKAAPTLQEQAAKAVAASAGLGPSVPGNLRGDLKLAQRDQIQTLGDAANLQRDLGDDKAVAAQGMADLREQNAIRMQQDAEIQQQADARVAQQHEAFLARNEALANEIATKQIDPSRLLHNADTKTQFIVGLGAALGGASAVATGGPNRYLDHLDKLIDRDIASQANSIDNAKTSLSARQSLFGQMVQETGDRRLAALQTRNLTYEAMKTKLMADADRLGIPEIRTNAEIAANDITQKQKALQTQIAQTSLQNAIAAQSAWAASQRQAAKDVWDHEIEIMKLKQEQQKIDKAGGEGAKATGERAVVLDGRDELAVNKTAAEKWNEYNHGRAVFAQALEGLKASREKGDVGAYNAYRATLIEEYPKLLGYSRAPSQGQIMHTVGPEAIPEYNHWYQHAATLGTTYAMQQGRAAEKIKTIDEVLATSDKAMRENTFGARAPTAGGANAPNFTPDKAAK